MPCMSAVPFSVISCKNARCLRHPTVSGLLSWSGTGPALPIPFQVTASLSVPPNRNSVWFPETKAPFNSAAFLFLYIFSCQLIGTKLAVNTCFKMVTHCAFLVTGEGKIIQPLCF